jgi:hypothetical protein
MKISHLAQSDPGYASNLKRRVATNLEQGLISALNAKISVIS